ncbi:nicotinate phosphoribosyltransferase (plasmid) [Clostridium perfringens]
MKIGSIVKGNQLTRGNRVRVLKTVLKDKIYSNCIIDVIKVDERKVVGEIVVAKDIFMREEICELSLNNDYRILDNEGEMKMREYNNRSSIWDLDAYKVGHMTQYPGDTEYIYSVMQLRSDRYFKKTPIVGLQYLLKEYLMQKIEKKDVDQLIEELKLMGVYHPGTEEKLSALVKLGYLPLKIKSLPEGSVVNLPNAICTVENTVPGFHWVVGFFETLLLKWWSALATASCSLEYRNIVDKYFDKTSDNLEIKPFTVHDFGSRGCMTPEGAAFTGMAHALNFYGSDTIMTIPLLRKYYDAKGMVIASVPASEHSIMCSYGREEELEAFNNMLDLYPTGIVSIVSDTYDWYNVMDHFTLELKDKILTRDGKTVFRPDSGDPIEIICGTIQKPIKDLSKYNAKELGGIRALDKVFGHTINSKGYKVLNTKVGLIYGDGMYLERYEKTLELLEKLGYSAENLVIGVGGILRNHTRDTLGAAFKATCVKRKSKEWMPIMKDPVTDKKKKSYCGFIGVEKREKGYKTLPIKEIKNNELVTVFENGKLIKDYSWDDIKDRYSKECK